MSALGLVCENTKRKRKNMTKRTEKEKEPMSFDEHKYYCYSSDCPILDCDRNIKNMPVGTKPICISGNDGDCKKYENYIKERFRQNENNS